MNRTNPCSSNNKLLTNSKSCNELFERFTALSDDVFDELDIPHSVASKRKNFNMDISNSLEKRQKLLEIFESSNKDVNTQNSSLGSSNTQSPASSSILCNNIAQKSAAGNEAVITRSTAVTSPQLHQVPFTQLPPKPKFPGPAGLLPNISQRNYVGESDNFASQILSTYEKSMLKKREQDTGPSMSLGPLWHYALRDLELSATDPGCLINRCNIKRNVNQLRNTGSVSLSTLKRAPLLIVQISSITPSHNQATVLCNDHTGEVTGLLSCSAAARYQHLMSCGCVLVLRHVTVWCSAAPCRPPVLAITEENIAALYTAANKLSSDIKAEKLQVKITSCLSSDERRQLKQKVDLQSIPERSLVEENYECCVENHIVKPTHDRLSNTNIHDYNNKTSSFNNRTNQYNNSSTSYVKSSNPINNKHSSILRQQYSLNPISPIINRNINNCPQMVRPLISSPSSSISCNNSVSVRRYTSTPLLRKPGAIAQHQTISSNNQSRPDSARFTFRSNISEQTSMSLSCSTAQHNLAGSSSESLQSLTDSKIIPGKNHSGSTPSEKEMEEIQELMQTFANEDLGEF